VSSSPPPRRYRWRTKPSRKLKDYEEDEFPLHLLVRPPEGQRRGVTEGVKGGPGGGGGGERARA